jgi:3-methyladenine DNA glycosylase AlkD
MTTDEVKSELRALGSEAKAAASAWFFKTGLGEYAEGDMCIGVTVPEQRRVAKKYAGLPLDEAEALLHSTEHEFRLTALIIWVNQFKKADEAGRAEIYRRYLANTKWINNWDLVDTSAEIVGAWLADKDTSALDKLARSENLWERRIAIVATYYFIKQGMPGETLRIADILASDKHDLIHKAVGWMLREVGKRCSEEVLEAYLAPRYKTMPRTMLRYAIEKFAPEIRKRYLAGTI